ncbi:MAG: tyrosine-type recombinase/integrase [Methanobacteriaceae archaeon]|nr:tyrosine-type recombinase/integrase [Methanobacteriaceae archaeon]
MKTRFIHNIETNMKPYLNEKQLIKLNTTLLELFKDIKIVPMEDLNNKESENNDILLLNFISAKRVEGYSERTLSYYKTTLEKMLKTINKKINSITADDLRNYLANYKEETKSSKITIDNIRRILSSFFSWLEEEYYILKNPVRRIHKIKTGKVVKEVLTDENFEILRDNCENIRDLALVELLNSTGIRVGELVNLNIEDIKFNERECIVLGKGNSEREVYFDVKTKIHLLKYLNSRNDDNEALLVSLKKPYTRLTTNGIETRIRKIGRDSKIKKIHPHKFRRTMATTAIDKGCQLNKYKDYLVMYK